MSNWEQEILPGSRNCLIWLLKKTNKDVSDNTWIAALTVSDRAWVNGSVMSRGWRATGWTGLDIYQYGWHVQKRQQWFSSNSTHWSGVTETPQRKQSSILKLPLMVLTSIIKLCWKYVSLSFFLFLISNVSLSNIKLAYLCVHIFDKAWNKTLFPWITHT